MATDLVTSLFTFAEPIKKPIYFDLCRCHYFTFTSTYSFSGITAGAVKG